MATLQSMLKKQIIMPKILCLMLDKYLKILDLNIGPLFLSKRKKRISARTLQDIFKKAADELDIDKHLHAHLNPDHSAYYS